MLSAQGTLPVDIRSRFKDIVTGGNEEQLQKLQETLGYVQFRTRSKTIATAISSLSNVLDEFDEKDEDADPQDEEDMGIHDREQTLEVQKQSTEDYQDLETEILG